MEHEDVWTLKISFKPWTTALSQAISSIDIERYIYHHQLLGADRETRYRSRAHHGDTFPYQTNFI